MFQEGFVGGGAFGPKMSAPAAEKKFKMKYIFKIRMFGYQTSFHLSAVLSPFACALSIASVLSLSIALLILQLQFKIGI